MKKFFFVGAKKEISLLPFEGLSINFMKRYVITSKTINHSTSCKIETNGCNAICEKSFDFLREAPKIIVMAKKIPNGIVIFLCG